MCRESNHLVTLCLYKNSRKLGAMLRVKSFISREKKRGMKCGKRENGGGLNMGLSVYLCRMHVCVCDGNRLRGREDRLLSLPYFSNSELFRFTTALRGEQPKIQ